MSEETESGKRRRYYWHCPQCLAYVAREAAQCQCGAFKAERARSHAHVDDARPGVAEAWRLIVVVALSSLGLLWVLLE